MKTKAQLNARAKQLFNLLPAELKECHLGGCDNHSGHETCSRMENYDLCLEKAEMEAEEEEAVRA